MTTDNSARRHGRARARQAGRSAASAQAAAVSAASRRNGGVSWAQAGIAFGQRVRNTQPDGGSIGEGMSPGSSCSTLWRSTRGSGTGMADSSASVYGWPGRAYSASLVAIYIALPM